MNIRTILKKSKRWTAAFLAAAITCVTLAPHVLASVDEGESRYYGNYVTQVGSTNDPSWTDTIEQWAISRNGRHPTGLNFGSLGTVGGSDQSFWNIVAAETNVPGDFDYSAFNKIRMYCVDGHTGDAVSEIYNQSFSKGILKMDENGDLVFANTGEPADHPVRNATNKKFTMLMLIAMLGYYADWSEVVDDQGFFVGVNEIDSWHMMSQGLRSLIWGMTDGAGYTGNWQEDLARFTAQFPGTETGDPIANPVAAAMGCNNAHKYFWSAWMAATLNMNMSFDEEGHATKNPSSSVTNADGSITNCYDFSKELVQAGIQNLLDVQVEGGTYEWDPASGMLKVTAPAGTEVSGRVVAKGASWDGQIDASIPNFGTAKIGRFEYIKVLDARPQFDIAQNYMSVVFTDAYEFSFGASVKSPSGVNRYDHEEEWSADYNIRLNKFDSETGLPLQGSEFDVLEKFDDTQLDNTDLEANSAPETANGGELVKYASWEEPNTVEVNFSGDTGVVQTVNNLRNWDNDNGSQFERWEDPYDDPCPRDQEVTNENGQLTTTGTHDDGTLAHRDTKMYRYHKGFCGGHPAPEIQYIQCTHGEGEECDCDEQNQKLHDEAWDKWYEEVETCMKLVNEGGFFHAIDEGAAQKAMEEDRDQFYKDFTSITYEYSAVETKARTGYILHDYHTDDIPIEWRTVTSSQYKDWTSRGSLKHKGGSGEGGEGGDAAEFSSINNDASPATRINDSVYSSDVFYDDIIIGSPSNAVRHAYDNALAEYLANHETDTADTDQEKEDEVLDLPDIELADGNFHGGDIEVVDEARDEIKDEILDESVDETRSNAVTEAIRTATGSDAIRESEALGDNEDLDNLVKGTHSAFSFRELLSGAGNFLRNSANSLVDLLALNNDDDEGGGSGGGSGTGGKLHETLVTEPSIANTIDPDDPDIIDWTFIVYDHRTEGEVHINKRDFNLSDNTSDVFDDYSGENGDGSLEGAVYGLFAQNDIIHPDGKTGVVYKSGDLVAIATTDRNGDASFMSYTEAPGTHYNYETGQTETYSWNSEAPTNLHREQNAAAAEVQDIETFEGHDPDNEEITAGNGEDLTDTSDSGSPTWYKKYSTNQEYDSGKLADNEVTNEKRDTYRDRDTTGYYPILDNDANNGNCWIGRPIIVSGENSAFYYVKELSRSEGYELSVSGRDAELTNRYADLDSDQKLVTLDVTKITKDSNGGNGVMNYNGFDVHSEGTDAYRVEMSNVPGDQTPHVYIVTEEEVWDPEAPAGVEVTYTPAPQEAIPGNYVYLDGKKVEATVGQQITLPNGETAYVQAVSSTDPLTLTVMPDNHITTTMPEIALENQSNVVDTEEEYKWVVTKYNNALTNEEVNLPKAYAKAAPYFLVDLSNATTVQQIADALNDALGSQTLFNRFYVQEIREIGGVRCAVVRYSYMEGASTIPVAIYDEATKTIYLHATVTYRNSWPNEQTGEMEDAQGYVFVPYYVDEYTVVTSESDSFVTKAKMSQKRPKHDSISYPSDMAGFEFEPATQPSYWVYAEGEQMRDGQGNLLFTQIEHREQLYGAYVTKYTHKEITPVTKLKDGTYSFNVELSNENAHDTKFQVTFDSDYDSDGQALRDLFAQNGIISLFSESEDATSYVVPDIRLNYPGQETIVSDAGTVETPARVYERPVRQQVRIEKDIQTLPETLEVWYCLNCGHENQDDVSTCPFCGRERTTEETRQIDYANDTYAAFHSENISAERDGGLYDTSHDWLSSLLGDDIGTESPESIGNFRFKAYLKSNLERLYRDEDGHVTWMDRNGNTMTPQYEDTNGDGNYDTFTWKYDNAYGGKTVDFPEKDKISADNELSVSNVQKIYTEVEHRAESKTTSDRANNVWDTYADPQAPTSARDNTGEIEGYTTSERGASGDAVKTNAALYSYDGKARDRNTTDYLQDEQNHNYTRLLETRRQEIEDGTGMTSVETYNYEKFFDAIQAANTDIWDDDMYSTYDGEERSMENYPGQHWFETFYEKYQKDDADWDHTIENTDNDDSKANQGESSTGGDRDTSFKPFRWIREKVFGDRTDYETYPAERNGENTENTINTSDYARANAQASDAVRQFAVKWYLNDEAAKLMVDNGLGENVANLTKYHYDGLPENADGTIGYDEAVYDLALFNAIAKAYNYLKPFYLYDLDTIYSVEWDSAKDGGSDNDYTTLSTDIREDERYSNVSAYLPCGVYVIVEQTPQRRDKKVNDWENRSYDIEKPKEVIVPSLYEGTESNNTTDNYNTHYNFNSAQSLTDQAKKENYLIRFGEENSANTAAQDDREFVIRAHNYYGDYEIYKYGLDVDRLQASINAPNGAYNYGGWDITQEIYDPLKDYYEPDHRGEEGVVEIQTENGGNQDSNYHGYDANVTANGNGVFTANGSNYDGDSLRRRFFYASISEDDGTANKVLFKDGATDQNNVSGMAWHDNVDSTTGELTAYNGKYSAALVPWTVTAPTDSHTYSAENFSGYADLNERDRFYTAYLKINKTDSETGEYILHDDAVFGLYAASRYNSFDEIEADAELIEDPGERARFLLQFRPGDAKFYLQDTMITGTKEFLEAMKARDLTPYKRRGTLNESMAGPGELYTGIVSKGTPVCIESERVDLYDGTGTRTGQMTVWTTRADMPMDDPETQTKLELGGQNVGYFKTSQPIGAGVYVLAEIKPPSGYARSNPVAIEVYSNGTTYYVDGDMYAKVDAVRYKSKTTDEYPYK